MVKTNKGLASFAIGCLGRPYIYGTYGQILTERLLADRAKTYPSRLGPERVKYARDHYLGKRVSDCEGMIKNYLWADTPNDTPLYNASQDLSANGAFDKATVKGKIGTLPEIPGICIRYNGHVGVYIGDGWVVEERGFNYGCVNTRLKDRNWTDWFQHPWIQYEDNPQEDTCMIEMPVLKKTTPTTKNQSVKTVQACLDIYGYGLQIDGSFGGKTDAAVRAFQKSKGLTVDGVVGQKTWTALLK